MIPAALLAAGQFIAGCKVCRTVLLAIVAALALWLWTVHVRDGAAAEARAAAVAEVQAATEQEHERRQAVLEQAQAEAQAAADKLAVTEKTNASLLARMAELSRAHDADGCLGADATRRLQQIGGRPTPGH